MLQAVTVELPRPRRLESTVTVTLGDRHASGRVGNRKISWEPRAYEAWYQKLQLSTVVRDLMPAIYLGKLQQVVSSRCCQVGGLETYPSAHANWRLIETRFSQLYVMTSLVCSDIRLNGFQ